MCTWPNSCPPAIVALEHSKVRAGRIRLPPALNIWARSSVMNGLSSIKLEDRSSSTLATSPLTGSTSLPKSALALLRIDGLGLEAWSMGFLCCHVMARTIHAHFVTMAVDLKDHTVYVRGQIMPEVAKNPASNVSICTNSYYTQ